VYPSWRISGRVAEKPAPHQHQLVDAKDIAIAVSVPDEGALPLQERRPVRIGHRLEHGQAVSRRLCEEFPGQASMSIAFEYVVRVEKP